MDRQKLARELANAAKRLASSTDKYEVREEVSPSRGNTYKFVFVAKKKKGGLFGKVLSIAKDVALASMYGSPTYVAETVISSVVERRFTTTPIEKEIEARELAAILERWSSTIPKGYIETIGSTLSLPQNDKFIVATIKPGKEIKIVMDMITPYIPTTQQETPTQPIQETQPQPPQPQVTPQSIQTPTVIPASIPVPTVDFSSLYVKGSLTTTNEGTSLAIRNPAGPATVVGPIRVAIDGNTHPPQKTIIVSSQGKRRSDSISPGNPVRVAPMETLMINLQGLNLSSGIHKIDIWVPTAEAGEILISVTDKLQ